MYRLSVLTHWLPVMLAVTLPLAMMDLAKSVANLSAAPNVASLVTNVRNGSMLVSKVCQSWLMMLSLGIKFWLWH